MRVGGINYQFGPTADAILGYQIMKEYSVLKSDAVLGAYRWSENETMNPLTLYKLVQADELFAQYRVKLSLTACLYGKLFGQHQYNRNVEIKIHIDHMSHGNLIPADFNDIRKYKPVTAGIQVLYAVITWVYKLSTVVI